jgi:putative transposase
MLSPRRFAARRAARFICVGAPSLSTGLRVPRMKWPSGLALGRLDVLGLSGAGRSPWFFRMATDLTSGCCGDNISPPVAPVNGGAICHVAAPLTGATWRVPRKRRHHLPRAGFHITARTQNGAPHFTPEMRSGIADDIERAMFSFGHTLLAYVVMPNHFHIVLRQGDAPLSWVMLRIMQRTVARVRRAHRGEGHVFGRPYWSCVCGDPRYLRRAIVYTHLNPHKANLCRDPANYVWSSHRNYLRIATAQLPRHASPLEGVMLFADATLDLRDAMNNYERFIDFCIARRRDGIEADWLLPEGPNRRLIPSAAQGDTYWAANYSAFTEANSFTRDNVDVAHPAIQLLSRIDRDLLIDDIRRPGTSLTLRRIRQQLIEGLIIHGCRTTAIARYLHVSPSLVSQASGRMRESARTKH